MAGGGRGGGGHAEAMHCIDMRAFCGRKAEE